MSNEQASLLVMAFYDGEYTGEAGPLTHICDIDGSVTRVDGPAFTVLEETRRVLELCSKRYSTPVLTGPALTVFIGRKVRGVTTSLARLDIVVRHGRAYTSIVRSDAPRVDLEPVLVDSDDDVVSIAIKVLESAQ